MRHPARPHAGAQLAGRRPDAQSSPFNAVHVQDFVVERLRAVPHLSVRCPDGAFYIFADVRALVGPGVQAPGFGPVPDDDTLCRWAGTAIYLT